MIVLRLSSEAFLVLSEITIGLGTLRSLAGEVCAKLFEHILWEDVRWVNGRVTEVKHTQILLLFGSSVNLYSRTGLLLPLMAGRVFLVRIGCCGIALASVTLFGRESGVGSGARCTIREGILIILP